MNQEQARSELLDRELAKTKGGRKGGSGNAVEEAKRIAREQTADTASALSGIIKGLQQQAEADYEKARRHLDGNTGGSDAGKNRLTELNKLKSELAELRKQAAEGVTAEAKKKAGAEGIDLEAHKVAVGFSGSALALQLGGGSQDKVVKGIGDLRKVAEQQRNLLEKIEGKKGGLSITA
jgi:hypothetical protein